MICSECQNIPGEVQKLSKHFCGSCWIFHCNSRVRKRLLQLREPVTGTVGGQGRGVYESVVSSTLENVLIYYDGGISARALLDLVCNIASPAHSQGERGGDTPAISTGRFSKLPFPFCFTILYLTGCGTDEAEVMRRRDNESINFLRGWLAETRKKLPLHFSSPLVVATLETTESSSYSNVLLNMIKEESVEDDSLLPLEIQQHRQLLEMLRNIKSKSSRHDLLRILRERIQVSTAKALGRRKIVLPEDQTSMTISMFSMMSTGRGEQVAEQMNLVTAVDGVCLCRPLIDLSSDDLRDYGTVVGLDLGQVDAMVLSSVPNNSSDQKSKIDSVGRHCEDFIVGLQREYPATVPTLARIGGKLEPSVELGCNEQEVEKCKLCKRPLKQINNDMWCYGCRNLLTDMVIG